MKVFEKPCFVFYVDKMKQIVECNPKLICKEDSWEFCKMGGMNDRTFSYLKIVFPALNNYPMRGFANIFSISTLEACEPGIRKISTALKETVRPLFESVGDLARCKSCDAEIYFVKHKNGKVAPYNIFGVNHFADCPHSKKHKKDKK